MIDDLSNGGAERQLTLLVENLPNDWEGFVWSFDGGPFADVIRDSEKTIQLGDRRWRFDIRPCLDLWRRILQWEPDLVHSWGWMSSVTAGPLCRLLNIPFIDGTIRMGVKSNRRRIPQRLGMIWANRIISNNQSGLAAWHISSLKGRVVYNGVDLNRITLTTEKGAKPSNRFSVVMTGRMTDEKDFSTFFKAARELINNDSSPYRFIAVGQGPNRKSLMKDVADLMETGIVSFPEVGLEPIDIVRTAQAGILMSNPSNAEGCSNSILEYMACGLPVICSEGGGNSEVVVNGKTGLIIPIGDSQALAEGIRYFRKNPDIKDKMGKAGFERVMNEFSVTRMVRETIKVYDELRN